MSDAFLCLSMYLKNCTNAMIRPPNAAVPKWKRNTIKYEFMTVQLETALERSAGAVKYLENRWRKVYVQRSVDENEVILRLETVWSEGDYIIHVESCKYRRRNHSIWQILDDFVLIIFLRTDSFTSIAILDWYLIFYDKV